MFKLDSLHSKQQKCVDELLRIWDEMGLTVPESQQRYTAFCAHIENSCHRMLRDEEQLLADICEDITKLKSALRSLSDEMHVAVPEVNERVGKVDVLRQLGDECAKLEEVKEERLKQLRQLREQERLLCRRLKKPFIAAEDKSVPSHEFLEQLEHTINGLKEEKMSRERVAREAKAEIEMQLAELEMQASGGVETMLLRDGVDAFTLSNENMSALSRCVDELKSRSQKNFETANKLRERLQHLCQLSEAPEAEQQELLSRLTGFRPSAISAIQKEIERFEEVRRQNIEKFVTRARIELEQLWDACYIGRSERHEFLPFYAAEFNEEILKQHEDEISKMKKYRDEHAELFNKVAKREELWAQFLEFEKATSDPNRFKTRHYNPINEERERKRYQGLLPKLEKDLADLVKELEETTGRVFTMGGIPFREHLETQWAAYNEHKELEKKNRQIKKEIQTKEEMFFGSRPNTPRSLQKTRKRLHEVVNTPTSVSRKRAREDLRPVSESKVVHSSIRTPMASRRNSPQKQPPAKRQLRGIFADMKNVPTATSSPKTSTASDKEPSSSTSSYADFKPNAAANKHQTGPVTKGV